MKRANLTVESEALAQRVVLEGRKAVGVVYRKGGEERTARARCEVLLAAGAIQSPQLLELLNRRAGLLRNAAVVLGNVGDTRALPALEKALQDEEEVVREAAQWAIERIYQRLR